MLLPMVTHNISSTGLLNLLQSILSNDVSVREIVDKGAQNLIFFHFMLFSRKPPSGAENKLRSNIYCFCRAIKILDPQVADFWATFKKPLADLCAFLMQMRQKKYEKTVKKQAYMVVYCPYLRKWI